MSQIIMTGNPTFEDVKYLVDMLPEGDRIALRHYLTSSDAEDREKEFDEVISRFRTHGHTEQEVAEAVAETIRKVRDGKAAEGI